MTIAVIAALTMSMNWVFGAFGLWAIFSGLLQLGTAVRRWKTTGGEWAMVLSGGQSAVAGALFMFRRKCRRSLRSPRLPVMRTSERFIFLFRRYG